MPFPDAKYPYDQRLVRSASRLLEACKLALVAGDQDYVRFIIAAAIAKAEGKERE